MKTCILIRKNVSYERKIHILTQIADPPIEEYENVATLPRSGSGLKMDKAKLMTAVKKGQTDVVNKLIGKGKLCIPLVVSKRFSS